VDFERQQRGRPVPGSCPLWDGVEDGKVEQLAGGVLAREMAFGFDRFAQLAVERLDRVGSKRRLAARSYTLRFERVLVVGRPRDLPGCASSANP
jgi:hypothetical protein